MEPLALCIGGPLDGTRQPFFPGQLKGYDRDDNLVRYRGHQLSIARQNLYEVINYYFYCPADIEDHEKYILDALFNNYKKY